MRDESESFQCSPEQKFNKGWETPACFCPKSGVCRSLSHSAPQFQLSITYIPLPLILDYTSSSGIPDFVTADLRRERKQQLQEPGGGRERKSERDSLWQEQALKVVVVISIIIIISCGVQACIDRLLCNVRDLSR